jgi:hypothetical protein
MLDHLTHVTGAFGDETLLNQRQFGNCNPALTPLINLFPT